MWRKTTVYGGCLLDRMRRRHARGGVWRGADGEAEREIEARGREGDRSRIAGEGTCPDISQRDPTPAADNIAIGYAAPMMGAHPVLQRGQLREDQRPEQLVDEREARRGMAEGIHRERSILPLDTQPDSRARKNSGGLRCRWGQ